MRCEAGTAAVRSSQFPYGTKLYVRTADGKFVYGYTVTNDTGVGLMQNVIDIDLYYESYLESALNGRRIVDIYVLEYSSPPTSGPVRR
jgi:3D (Asp-Asp-Asp) domain-containing protein